MRELMALCTGMALLIMLAVFIAGGGTAQIGHSIALNGISPSSQTAGVFPCSWFGNCPPATTWYYSLVASQTSITPGQQVQLVYTAGASQASGGSEGWCPPSGNLDGSPATCSLTGFGAVYTSDATRSGTVYVYPTTTSTYTFCSVIGNSYSGCQSVTIIVVAACTVSSFGSPWNSNSYLIYSGGVGSISNWYGRYCVTNYSGNAIFIPMATPGEWNNFAAQAPAIGVGIVGY